MMGIAMLALCAVLLIRNAAVYRYRTALLEAIREYSKRQIAAGQYDDWWWTFTELNAVSYERMLVEFWRPLSSFYRGTRLQSEVLLPGRRDGAPVTGRGFHVGVVDDPLQPVGRTRREQFKRWWES